MKHITHKVSKFSISLATSLVSKPQEPMKASINSVNLHTVQNFKDIRK